MRTTLFGLAIPLLLLAVGFATVIPQAAGADGDVYEISGRVISDAGEPIEGARVNGYTYSETRDQKMSSAYQNADAITDADGVWTLRLAAGKGWLNVYYDTWRQGDGREINVEGDQSGIDFTLKTPPPKNAILEGIVVNADGEPIEGAHVTLSYACCYARPMEVEASASSAEGSTEPASAPADDRMAIMPPYYDDWATATTDADGKFSFKSYPGPHQLTVAAKGFAQETQTVTSKEDETVKVLVKLLKVPPRDAILSGHVIDSATGLPVEGAQISARSLEWGRYASATTDKTGAYTLTTVRGWTQIDVNFWQIYPVAVDAGADASLVRPARPDEYFPHSAIIKLATGDNDEDIKLDMKPKPTIALIGYVIDPDAQKGIPDAQVNVWNAQTGDWGQATTDKTGSFKILVSPGHYTANAWKDGYLGGSQTFIVKDDAVSRLDIVLPKGISRWAPCEDDNDCGYPIMYAEKGGVAMTDSAAPSRADSPTMAPAPASAPPSQNGAVEARTTPSNGANAGADSGREATFSGTGGGLPEYDPNARDTVPAAEHAATSEVPGLGLLALLGAAAAGALVMRKRA